MDGFFNRSSRESYDFQRDESHYEQTHQIFVGTHFVFDKDILTNLIHRKLGMAALQSTVLDANTQNACEISASRCVENDDSVSMYNAFPFTP